jgi:hypothetical protein
VGVSIAVISRKYPDSIKVWPHHCTEIGALELSSIAIGKIALSAFTGEAFTASCVSPHSARNGKPLGPRLQSSETESPAKTTGEGRDPGQQGPFFKSARNRQETGKSNASSLKRQSPGAGTGIRHETRQASGEQGNDTMVALASVTSAPALEKAGFFTTLAPIAERLDARAFVIVQSREEAEFLLMRDHSEAVADSGWTAMFVEGMVEFLIWQNQPSGRIAQDDLDWFVGLVGDAPSPSIPALLFALVRELNEVPEQLMALALRFAKNRLALSN